MRGILFERGKWIGASRAKITDTRLELSLFKLDLFTVGIRFVKISVVDKGLARNIHELCAIWAAESQTFNPQPMVGHLAQEILSLVYRAQTEASPSSKNPVHPA